LDSIVDGYRSLNACSVVSENNRVFLMGTAEYRSGTWALEFENVALGTLKRDGSGAPIVVKRFDPQVWPALNVGVADYDPGNSSGGVVVCEYDMNSGKPFRMYSTGEVIATAYVPPASSTPVQNVPVQVFGGRNGYLLPSENEPAVVSVKPARDGTVTVRVYTLRGDKVWEKPVYAWAYDIIQVRWFCEDSDGGKVASGIYIVHVTGPDINEKKKVAVVR